MKCVVAVDEGVANKKEQDKKEVPDKKKNMLKKKSYFLGSSTANTNKLHCSIKNLKNILRRIHVFRYVWKLSSI